MISRYSIMTESAVLDSVTKETYPDPLSIDFGSFTYNEPPLQVEPDENYIRKPYLLTYAQYGVTYYDDIILMINNIPHVSLMGDKTVLLLPVQNDLRGFMKV